MAEAKEEQPPATGAQPPMLERLFTYLKPAVRRLVVRPLPVLAAGLLLAVAGFLLASRLRIDNDLARLIPESYPSVQALQELREQVGGEHEASVAIRSPSFEANLRFAQDLVPRALALRQEDRRGQAGEPFFVRAELRREIDFLERNALYFATGEELDRLETYLEEEVERAREEANPFFFDLEEELGEKESETDSTAEELNRQYEELVGSEYTLSADSTILVVKLFPSGAQTDLDFIEAAYARLDELTAAMDPASYHPQMEVFSAGRLIRTLIEIESITADVKDSFGLGVLMLMAVVLGYFFYRGYRIQSPGRFSARALGMQFAQLPAHLVIMGLPLAMSLCWTFGTAWLAYGHLNIMTSTLGLLLFGMGIDFGIHFYARYTEERTAGADTEEAILTTFMTTGQAIFAVGLTTAAGFIILMLADFKGFSEFGFIAGTGLLYAIIAYIFLLPALLVVMEGSPLLNLGRGRLPVASGGRGVAGDGGPASGERSADDGPRSRLVPWTVIALAGGLSLAALWWAPKLSFEYDFSRLEPVYERWIERNRVAGSVYTDRGTRNAAYILTDRPEDAPAVAEVLRRRAASDSLSPTIRKVETFQDRYPLHPDSADRKLEQIARIRDLLDDPFLEGSADAGLERLRQAAGTSSPISLSRVPDFLKAPFTSADGLTGNMVIVYPSVGLSDGRNSMAFAEDVGRVTLSDGTVYHAGSTSIVASDMLRLMIDEAPLMVALILAFIIVFKMIILRRIRWMVLALLPLAFSFLWLFGLMEAAGWSLNFYNLVVLPTILGIGDDSGIHLVHRYLEEGKGSVGRVMRTTGEHVGVSGVTTMLGFGGLLFSIHPGMRSIGEVAVLGIGLSLVAALLLLPSLLRVVEGFRNKGAGPAPA